MKLYIFAILLSFIIGNITGFYLNILFKQKKVSKKNKLPKNDKYYKVSIILEKVKKGEKLPIDLPVTVLNAIKEVARTPNWKNELDEETIKNLNTIYDRCVRKKTSCNNTVKKTSKSYGFKRKKVLEGTIKEYEDALNNGEITDNTEVIIYDDTGPNTYISMDEDGNMEEYME